MEEFELLVNPEDKYIIKNIDLYIDKLLLDVTVDKFSSGNYICYVFSGENVEDSLLTIFEIIYICKKFKFLYDNIAYNSKESLFFYAFLGIVCSANQQRELIEKILPSFFNVKKLNLDGLENFILDGLKQDWIRYGGYYAIALRLNNIDSKEKETKILKSAYLPSEFTQEINFYDCLGIINTDGIEDVMFLIADKKDYDIIFNIFFFSPKKVVLNCKNLSNEVLELINAVFCNKI